jgi:uncharacterized repeat protein (TIGR02543 family)
MLWKKNNASVSLILWFISILAITLIFTACSSDDSLSYRVFFNSNGGQQEAGEYIVTGRTVYQPGDPYKAGAVFKGWFADAALTKPYNFYSKVTKDITIYAKWALLSSDGSGTGSGSGTGDSGGSGTSGGGSASGTGGGTSGGSGGTGTGSDTGGGSGSGGTSGGDGGSGTGTDTGSGSDGGSGTNGGTSGGDSGSGTGTGTDGGSGSDGGGTDSGTGTDGGSGSDGSGTDSGTGTDGDSGNTGDRGVVTVSFDSNGGSTVLPRTVHVGDALNMDPDEIPTRAGATFSGWYTDDGTPYVFSSSTPVTNDITLHAKWVTTGDHGSTGSHEGNEITVVTVSFEVNGGSPVPSQNVRSGNKATQPDTPTKAGFFFDGWYTDNTFSTLYDFSAPVTGNITLYANWVNPVTVNFETNGGSPVPASQTIYYDPDSKVTITPPDDTITRDGYSFVGWYTDNITFSNPYDFSAELTASITLYAKWIFDDMVSVVAGSFKMGTDTTVQEGEGPQHDVTITKNYYIAQFEVTQAQFASVMGGYNPSVFKGDSLPVETVNWYEAVEFCNKLSEQEGLTPVYTLSRRDPVFGYPIKSMRVTVNWNNSGYRLPTEAEWEYAAKGGRNSSGYDSRSYFIYSGDNIIDNVAWYIKTSGDRTHDDRKAPNELGIYDMSGNVWEWCWDQYDAKYYSTSPSTDPRGPGTDMVNSERTRVMRGGCFSSDDVRPRSVNRWRHIPSYKTDINGISEYQGFRIVCNNP